MAQSIDIKDVGVIDFPDDWSHSRIVSAIEHDIIPQHKEHIAKTGFMPALKGAGREALGSAAQFVGEATGSEAAKKYAQEEKDLAAKTFEATTAEDVSAAQGMLPTASRWISKQVTEPVGGIIGRYGVPMVAGVAGAALAPEIATAGLTGTALAEAVAANAARSAIASGISTAATNLPTATGEVLQRQQEATPGAPADMSSALLAGLVNSAIAAVGLPGTGPIAKALGPKLVEDAALLAPKVAAGTMTKEAAVKDLASRTENYARSMAANAVSGTGMMVGTEAATRAGAGQSLTDEEAMKAYGQSVKGALELAPLFGAFHGMGSRGTAMEQLATADQTRLSNEQAAADKIQAHHEATLGGNADQLQLAGQERGADVAGLKAAQDNINTKYDEALARKEALKLTLKGVLSAKIADELGVGDTAKAAKIEAERTRIADMLKLPADDPYRTAAPDLTHPDIQALDTVDGVKSLLAKLDKNKSYSAEEKAALRPHLQQMLTANKQETTVKEKLTDDQKKYYQSVSLEINALGELGVNTRADLAKMPLAHLQEAKTVIDEKASADTPKKLQPLYDRIGSILDDTIANHVETKEAGRADVRKTQDVEFARTLAAKRDAEAQAEIQRQEEVAARLDTEAERAKLEALKTAESRRLYNEKEATLRSIEKQSSENLPAEAFPKNEAANKEIEVSPEQKAAELESAIPATGKPRGPVPMEKENQNPLIDQKEVDLLRAKNESEKTAALRPATDILGKDIPVGQGGINRLAMPKSTVVPEAPKVAETPTAPLGNVVPVPRGNAGRNELAQRAQALELERDIKRQKAQIEALHARVAEDKHSVPDGILAKLSKLYDNEPVSAKEFPSWEKKVQDLLHVAREHNRKIRIARDAADTRIDDNIDVVNLGKKVRSDLEKDLDDATNALHKAIEAHKLESSDVTTTIDQDADMASHSKGKGEPKAPKEAKEVVPTTVEELKTAVKDWFNPVWLNQALNKGWLHIVDGTMADSNLSEATKLAHPDVKGVYVTDNGHVYLFTKGIPKNAELGVILHEIGEHKGLENLIGADRVVNLANRVREMAKGKGKDAQIAKEAMAMAEGEKASDKELIAYFGEIATNKYKLKPGMTDKPLFGQAIPWINTLWNAINKSLEKLHFNIDKIGSQDIVDLLYGSARLEMGKETKAIELHTTEARGEYKTGEWVATDLGNGRSRATFVQYPIELPKTEAGLEHKLAEKIMPSNAPKMTAADEKFMKDNNLTVFRHDKPVLTGKEKVASFMGGFQDLRDTLGVKIVGPLYSIHRKATEHYGSENFYTKTTNKLLGSLSAQHTLNSMYFATGAVEHGTMSFHDKGYALIKEFDSHGNKLKNIKDLNARWLDLSKALEADGHSPALVQQLMSTMAFADRYKSLIDKGMKTPIEFTADSYKLGKDLQAKHRAAYDAWRDTYNEIRNNKKEGLIKSGLFTAKKADEFLDRLEYIPLYRMTEGEGTDAVFMQSLVAAAREQKLKHGTEDFDLADPMGNILKNEMWLYQRMMRNNTANLLADQYSEMGIGRYIQNPKKGDLNIVTFLKDGELKNFQVDNVNDMAIFVAAPVAHGMAVTIARAVSGTLRRAITITPSFAYRQAFDDAERTWMQSGTKRSFAKTLALSAKEQFKNRSVLGGKESELAHEGRMKGLVGQVDFQDSFNHWMNHTLGREDDTWVGKINKYVEKAEMFAQNSDLAARLSVYEAVKEEGAAKGQPKDIAELEGALRAQMMINFNHKGTSAATRTMLAMVPFINARIQSDWRLIDALKGNTPGVSKESAKKMLAFKAAKFAAFTILYTMTRTDEPDYEGSSDESKDRNFLFNAGGVPIKVPVAPEYVMLKASIEHSYRLATGAQHETPAKLRHAMASGAMNLITSPTDVMPTIVRPFLENITNHSFFSGRALISPTIENQDTNKQFVAGQTSELAKWISDIGQGVLGDSLNVSPIKIDNVLRGVFGTVGQDVAATVNLITNWASDTERPSLKLSQIPELGAAFYNPEGNQRTADYYTLRDQVMKRHNTYLKLMSDRNFTEAKEYRTEHAKELALVPQVSAIGNQLAALRKQQAVITAAPISKMDGAAKREALSKLSARAKTIIGDRVEKMNDKLD